MKHETEIIATVIFTLAVLHTFAVKTFQHWAKKFPEGSVGENLLHLLGEVEVVFGLWSVFFFIAACFSESYAFALNYVNSRDFTEPLFVFAVMVVASTKPVIDLAETLIEKIAKLLPLPRINAFYLTCLVFGPLIGSFITEPAAMTVTAMILVNTLFQQKLSAPLKYATLGLLFVNISIGGTLTHFAAPPVVMVARTWNWDTPYLFTHFGWKALIAIVVSSLLTLVRFRNEFRSLESPQMTKNHTPLTMSLLHLLFLTLIVVTAHHPKIFISLLLLFLGFASVTREYQTTLKIREALLVSFFLGGLVTLGGGQSWWIADIITQLESGWLYLSAAGLTAVFDNAALTYLGSLVPDISEPSKYALVSGAVVGGGLTVIANAPNPIGFGILSPRFGDEGISPILLLKEALLPTVIAAMAFWFLP
jgi:hypothetical protein